MTSAHLIRVHPRSPFTKKTDLCDVARNSPGCASIASQQLPTWSHGAVLLEVEGSFSFFLQQLGIGTPFLAEQSVLRSMLKCFCQNLKKKYGQIKLQGVTAHQTCFFNQGDRGLMTSGFSWDQNLQKKMFTLRLR